MTKALSCDFSAADELLFLAAHKDLPALGPIRVQRAGLIGPWVELQRARQRHPEAFVNVVFEAPFAATIEAALARGTVSGVGRHARVGVFPLGRLGPEGGPCHEWNLWRARADQAAVAAGFDESTAAAIIGVLGELQDNVFAHSEAAPTGLAAFAVRPGSFEVAVSDAGIGVLASLRSHPEHAGLGDAGAALRVAVANGGSRFGGESGRGFGMGQAFRALLDHDGDLRFRSDDHALEASGHGRDLQGSVQLRQKARLPGLTVSVVCRVARGPGRAS